MTAPKTLTVTECHQLLDVLFAKESPPKTRLKGVRNHLLGCLMLEAGLRVGESADLQMSDLFFESKPVTSIIIRPEISKTRTERSVPVSNRLKTALEKYFINGEWVNGLCDSRFAFPRGYEGTPITTRQVERIINNAGWKALGRPVHPHMLRHTFASRLMRVTNMRTVQELLGHKHLSSTQIYTHPNEEDKKKAIEQSEISNSQ